MSWTEFKTLVTSRFTPKYVNIRAGVEWLDLRQKDSIKTYVGKFRGVVSTLQHVSDYDKQLKFIHELQPWARKLIFRMPQLPDNLQDLIRMAERLGDDAWTRRSLAARWDQSRWARTTTRGRSARNAKKTNICTRSLNPNPTMRQKGESRRHGRPVSCPKTRMRALDVAKRARWRRIAPKW